MTSPYHPTIQQFQAAAKLLDIEASHVGLDEALAQLAAWMDLAADHLTDDDRAVLVGIGGLLYREGLQQRRCD